MHPVSTPVQNTVHRYLWQLYLFQDTCVAGWNIEHFFEFEKKQCSKSPWWAIKYWFTTISRTKIYQCSHTSSYIQKKLDPRDVLESDNLKSNKFNYFLYKPIFIVHFFLFIIYIYSIKILNELIFLPAILEQDQRSIAPPLVSVIQLVNQSISQ